MVKIYLNYHHLNPSSIADDRVPCPYCKRKFNEQVAERHIPHCKNSHSRSRRR